MDLYSKLVIIWLLLIANIAFGQTGSINVDENHNGHKIFGLPTPTAGNEAATKAYADSVGGGGGGAVSSVFGRTGAVVSATNDYTFSQIGSTPTTLAGYGITDAQPIDADLTAIAALTGTHNIYYRSASNIWSSVTIGSGLDFTGATLSATGSGGNLSTTGSPLDNQVAVFTDATHVEGNSNLSFDSSTNILSSVIMSPTTGFRINGAAANRRILVGNATNFVQSTETYAVPGTSGNVMLSDGTNWTSAQQSFAGLSGNWTLAQGPSTTASKLLGRTDASAGIPQEITLGTNLAMSGTTLNATGGGTIASTTDILKGNGSGSAVALGSATTGKILKSNGTTFVASTETYAAPGTSGNVMKSDGTNWTSGTVSASAGGSTTQLQYNNGGFLDGLSNLTTDSFDFTFKGAPATTPYFAQIILKPTPTANIAGVAFETAFSASTQNWLLGSGIGSANHFRLYDVTAAKDVLSIRTGANHEFGIFGILGWTSTDAAGTFDTGLTRNTAGVVEVNSGTAGTFRDLKARTVNVTTSFQVNGVATAADYLNSSVSSQSPSTSDVYITGSNVVVPAGAFAAKGQYRCLFDVTKSAGTGGIVISVRTGTAGTTSDVANLTFTFPAGTSVADVGTFELFVNWRTVGSGTSAVVEGVCRASKNTVTAAGLWSDTSAAKTIVATVSSGFASNTFTNMGVSFNGGTAFAGTITTVQASLVQ